MKHVAARVIVAICLIFFSSTVITAADEAAAAPKLSSSANRAIAAYEEGLVRLKATFDKGVALEKNKLGRSLEAEMKMALRSGDLAGVQAIKALQTKLEQRTGLEETDMFGKPIMKESQATKGTLYAFVDESSQIYVNGRLVLHTDEYWRHFEAKDLSIGPGDMISLQYTNLGGTGGVTLGFLNSDGYGFATQASRWRVCKTATPTAKEVSDGAHAQIGSGNHYNMRDFINQMTGLTTAETIEGPIGIGTFYLATIIQKTDMAKSARKRPK